MSDVIPTGTTRDSQFLFERMTHETLAATRAAPGLRILDVASGFGQDALALRARGASVVGAEPSARMTAWARLMSDDLAKRGLTPFGQEVTGAVPHWVRGWSDALPFADASFDAAYCKGALDHFDCPARAIAEMARVTKPDGRVVLSVANFDSFACRAARAQDRFREGVLGREPRRGRRHYDVPADHFTRFELPLLREQAGRVLEIERVLGLSLAWGLPSWTRLVERTPAWLASGALRAADALARLAPRLADVIVLVGKPRLPR